MWKTAKKGLLFNIACSRCCTRHNLCFHVESSQHADQKQLTRRDVFDLDTESTHCQPDSCPARPVNVDDGPEDIRWIQGLGGEKLPPASYAFLLKPDFSFFLCIGEGSITLSPVFYSAAPIRGFIRRMAGARRVSPAVLRIM